MKRWLFVAPFSLAGLALATGAACEDPVRASQIAQLGPEAPSVPAGPRHRPGQPCLLCHVEGGDAEAYSVAGTIYLEPNRNKPAGGVDVLLLDSAGKTHSVRTNCAGNFYVKPSRYRPVYPLWATLRVGEYQIDMESPIYREGSCAACHAQPAAPTSAGQVFLLDDPMITVTLPACTDDGGGS